MTQTKAQRPKRSKPTQAPAAHEHEWEQCGPGFQQCAHCFQVRRNPPPSQTKAQHTPDEPIPATSAVACGCTMTVRLITTYPLGSAEGETRLLAINYCPLHAAAPDLLAACEATLTWFSDIVPPNKGCGACSQYDQHKLGCPVPMARDAVTKAKPGTGEA